MGQRSNKSIRCFPARVAYTTSYDSFIVPRDERVRSSYELQGFEWKITEPLMVVFIDNIFFSEANEDAIKIAASFLSE